VIATATFDSRNSSTVKINVTLEAGITSDVTAQIGSNTAKTETACSGTCQITLNTSNGVTASGGQVKVTAAEGGFVTVSYPSN
jgi:enolase